MMGGLTSFRDLSTEPSFIYLKLNEWVQFSKPGTYRVIVKSGRVLKSLSWPVAGVGLIESNSIELTIVQPTPEWQHETLRRAVAALQDLKAGSQARIDAIQVLRYLGTPDAARQLVRHLHEPELSFDCKFGIAGSPSRAAALDEMEALLDNPDFPIAGEFLDSMALASLTDGPSGLPAQREELRTHFFEKLGQALSRKKDEAAALSAMTIISEAAMRNRELPADVKRVATEQLIAGFDLLPVNRQEELMQYRFGALDSRAALPLLRRVSKRYEDFPELRESRAQEQNNVSAGALRRWYELEPEAARALIIEEILRPKPRFGVYVLGVLKDKQLPEAEWLLLEHLIDSSDYGVENNLATLIHRYASRALEAQVGAYLDEKVGRIACATQMPLLAYLLKQAPEKARSRIQAALSARGETTGCYSSLLPELGNLEDNHVLHEIAVSALDDHEPVVVASAADYLREHGKAEAESVLLSHLVSWKKDQDQTKTKRMNSREKK